MADPLPRRLRRFSKEGGVNTPAENDSENVRIPEGEVSPEKRGQIISAIIEQTKRKMQHRTDELASGEIERFHEKHSRYPQTEQEYDEIAESIYKQLKEETRREERDAREKRAGKGKGAKGGKESMLERRKRRRGAHKAGDESEATAGEFGGPDGSEEGELPDAKELEIKGLFGAKRGENELGLGDMGEGGAASLEDELKSLSLDDESDLVEKEIETEKNRCPNCKNASNDIIFCPECGSGFCNHCAKGIEVLEGHVKYTCPKCGQQFKGRKRQH